MTTANKKQKAEPWDTLGAYYKHSYRTQAQLLVDKGLLRPELKEATAQKLYENKTGKNHKD